MFSAANRGAWLRKSAGPVSRSFDQWPLSATRPDIADAGDQRTCSSDRSARRTKVIRPVPRRDQLPHARLGRSRLYITHATNGIKFTQLERQRPRRLRYEGHDATTPEEVSAA
jgi:hypothetical protein